jgi:hypothetical protein
MGRKTAVWVAAGALLVGLGAGCQIVAGLTGREVLLLVDGGGGGTGGGPGHSCNDGKRDGDETGKDCGGACEPCGDGEGCLTGADCLSSVCSGGTCLPSTCNDKVRNGDETDVDCGGPCPGCADGQACKSSTDCESQICAAEVCEAYHIWSVRFGDESDQHAGAVAVDAAGNVDLLVSVAGSVDFGGGPIATSAPAPAVAQVTTDEKYEWSRVTVASASAEGRGIATSGSGSVGIAGNATGNIDLGTGVLVAASSSNAIIAKYDVGGAPVWSRGFPNSRANAIAPTQGGGFVLTGQGDPATDYGCGALGKRGALILAVDALGQCVWNKGSAMLAYQQFGTSVAVDKADNAIVAGTANGEIDLGGGKMTAMGLDIFIAKFDDTGKHAWSKVLGDANGNDTGLVAVDPDGNVVVAGGFSGSIQAGGQALTSKGATDVFVLKMSPDGNFLWAKSFGDTGDESATAVAVDASGAVFIAGSAKEKLDFGGGPLGDAGSVFVVKLDASGQHVWSRSFASPTASVRAIASAGMSQVIVLGDFQGQIDLGGGPLMASGGADVFLAKLRTP